MKLSDAQCFPGDATHCKINTTKKANKYSVHSHFIAVQARAKKNPPEVRGVICCAVAGVTFHCLYSGLGFAGASNT